MSSSRRQMLGLGLGALLGSGVRIARAGSVLPVPPVPPDVLYPLPPMPPDAGVEAVSERPFIMVDPGHGGKDSGTIGLHGVEEKAITLATGLALRRALLATGRFRVGMTRTTDVFVTLAERVALAMGAHADLFFSLHCNEFARSAVRGAIVFTLSLSSHQIGWLRRPRPWRTAWIAAL